jgi:hypothetical protein
MKTRVVEIFTGKRFKVPECIQRIDHRFTHGWQLRYGGATKMFSDHTNDGSGAKSALSLATDELLRRIEKLPAPSGLQRQANVNKTTDLPVGISGPIVRHRKNSAVRDCSLSVSLPRFGQKPRKSTIYIGNENTFTMARYHDAVARAVEMRNKAEQAYQAAATKAKRAEGRALKAKRSA